MGSNNKGWWTWNGWCSTNGLWWVKNFPSPLVNQDLPVAHPSPRPVLPIIITPQPHRWPSHIHSFNSRSQPQWALWPMCQYPLDNRSHQKSVILNEQGSIRWGLRWAQWVENLYDQKWALTYLQFPSRVLGPFPASSPLWQLNWAHSTIGNLVALTLSMALADLPQLDTAWDLGIDDG